MAFYCLLFLLVAGPVNYGESSMLKKHVTELIVILWLLFGFCVEAANLVGFIGPAAFYAACVPPDAPLLPSCPPTSPMGPVGIIPPPPPPPSIGPVQTPTPGGSGTPPAANSKPASRKDDGSSMAWASPGRSEGLVQNRTRPWAAYAPTGIDHLKTNWQFPPRDPNFAQRYRNRDATGESTSKSSQPAENSRVAPVPVSKPPHKPAAPLLDLGYKEELLRRKHEEVLRKAFLGHQRVYRQAEECLRLSRRPRRSSSPRRHEHEELLRNAFLAHERVRQQAEECLRSCGESPPRRSRGSRAWLTKKPIQGPGNQVESAGGDPGSDDERDHYSSSSSSKRRR